MNHIPGGRPWHRFLKSCTALVISLLLLFSCACSRPAPSTAATAAPTAPQNAPTASPEPSPTPGSLIELPTPTPTEALPEVTPPVPLSAYDVAMRLLPEEELLVCAMKLDYVNASQDTLHDLLLHLYPNAYTKKDQLSAEELARDYPKGFSSAKLTIEKAAWGDSPATYTLLEQGELLLLTLPGPLAPGETANLYLRYTVTIPRRNAMLGKTELGYQLAYCIPTAAVYENGAWDTRTRPLVGDALYTQCADYRVAFTRPADYVAAASGTLLREETEADGSATAYYTMGNARDFCLCASQDYEVFQVATNSGARIFSYALTYESALYAGRSCRDMLNTYEQWLPAYPYTTFSVVQAALPGEGGMEFPGLIMIDRSSYLEGMYTRQMFLLAHECAHQWFYAAVGSDQIAEPWLDEALAQFLCVAFFVQNMRLLSATELNLISEDAAPEYAIDGSVYDYPNNNVYNDAVYLRGAYLFHALEMKLEDEAVFLDGLNRYYNAHLFGLATKKDLIDAFSQAAGEDLTPWFEEMLTPLKP